jgi:hypothetical protein
VRSRIQSGEQRTQLLDVRTELVHTAECVGERAEGGVRIAVALGQPPLEPVELPAQDEHARSTFFEQAPQLRLGHRARRFLEHVAQSLLQYGVELQPGLGHDGFGG